MKEVIETSKAPAAIGPYSQGIEANELVFVSGQLPVNPESNQIEASDIKGQAKQSLINVGEVLKAKGLSYESVVKTTCFIKEMSDFASFNEVYSEYFKGECPARSCVAVKELPKGALCEVEVIAVK